MKRMTAPTATVAIYIGGDFDRAKEICRHHVYSVGLCVTVEPLAFVYTGGEESGVRVGLINYPRFPSDVATLMAQAEALTELLIEGLSQHSAAIVGPVETIWLSRRET